MFRHLKREKQRKRNRERKREGMQDFREYLESVFGGNEKEIDVCISK